MRVRVRSSFDHLDRLDLRTRYNDAGDCQYTPAISSGARGGRGKSCGSFPAAILRGPKPVRSRAWKMFCMIPSIMPCIEHFSASERCQLPDGNSRLAIRATIHVTKLRPAYTAATIRGD